MRKYLQKMKELGLTDSTLSKNLKKTIKEFEEGVAEYNVLQKKLEASKEGDEDYENLKIEVNQYISLLEDEDDDITNKIIEYNNNKEYYQKKMAKARSNFKKSDIAPIVDTNTVANPQDGTSGQIGTQSVTNQISTAQTSTLNADNQNGNPPVVILPKEEKKTTNWLLWGGLGILGLIVGINVMKNRE